MKLFYNLLFKRGGKNVSVYIYLRISSSLSPVVPSRFSFKISKLSKTNGTIVNTHKDCTIVKREDNSSLDEPPSKTWKQKRYRVSTNPSPSIRTDRTLHAALTPKLARFHMKQPALWPDLIRHGRRSSVHRCYNFRRSVR